MVEGEEKTFFKYDQAGNIVLKNEISLGYDQANRMTRVEAGGRVTEYVFNASNQRKTKIENDKTTVYHYDQIGRLIAESDEQCAFLREYVYLNNELISIIDQGEKVYHVHPNHRQEPTAVTDGEGNVVWRSFSRLFGAMEVDEDPSNTGRNFRLNIRLPGQYFDHETGFHYNWHRFYDPGTGRYISPDPIGLAGGMNLYEYAVGDPVNRCDPFGLFEFDYPFLTFAGETVDLSKEKELRKFIKAVSLFYFRYLWEYKYPYARNMESITWKDFLPELKGLIQEKVEQRNLCKIQPMAAPIEIIPDSARRRKSVYRGGIICL